MERPDFWPDFCRFLLGFAGGGIMIGLYALVNATPIP